MHWGWIILLCAVGILLFGFGMLLMRSIMKKSSVGIGVPEEPQPAEDIPKMLEDARIQTEADTRRKITDEICRSALPARLKQSTAQATFDINGLLSDGSVENSVYYDYFFLDAGLLCVMVGEVPGNHIPEALFMVTAQTTIRSRLRMGRSLTETMADVNTQLYDLGGGHEIRVFVGILRTEDGNLTYVNSGLPFPFICRSGETYEVLKTPLHMPVGQQEHVRFRQEQIRMTQGDRLFLYTDDLPQMKNSQGETFGKREMMAALNRSRSRTKELPETLSFVKDEAHAFCSSGADIRSFAGLILEYKKSSRDYAYREVPAEPSSGPEVTAFIRDTCESAGISGKTYARLIVMTDELFVLCCRRCKKTSGIRVECAVAPDGQAVNVRMLADFGGENPLTVREDEIGQDAAEYISEHSDYVNFKHGEQGDLIAMVYFVEQS